MARPYVTLGLAVGLFVASLALFPIIEFSLFPESEKPMFLVNIKMPLGTNLHKTDQVARFVEGVLRKKEGIKSVFTNVGQGNPRIYYNVTPKNPTPQYAQIFVRLEPMELPEIERMVEELRTTFNRYPDAKIEVKQFEQGAAVESPVAIRLFGENLDTLRTLAGRVEHLIETTEGTIYTHNPLQTYKTDVHLVVNREKAALLSIAPNEVDQIVRMGVSGLRVAGYKDEKGDNLPIVLTMNRSKFQTIEVFDKLYVHTPDGAAVPVNQLASMEFETSVPTIKHYNKSRYVTITSYVKPGYNTLAVTGQVVEKLANVSFPKGFTYTIAGEVESSEESFGNLGTILLITIFGFLGILLLQFRTFKSTLIVFSVIPLGVVGAATILLLTGNTLSFIAVIGIIALAGIEVKNSILLVDYTNQLREEGLGIDEAIEVAGETRFLPIILTTLTAIGGLIPLVMEKLPLYSPLAWVLIGGLISSTILTRLVTPVLYKLLAPQVKQLVVA